MEPPSTGRSHDAIASVGLPKFFDDAYDDGDDLFDDADKMSWRIYNRCSDWPSTTNGSDEYFRTAWRSKPVNHEDVWLPYEAGDGHYLQADRRPAMLHDHSGSERETFAEERVAYHARVDLRDFVDIHADLGPYKPVKFHELSEFLDSFKFFGAQDSQIYYGDSEHQNQTIGKRWAFRTRCCYRELGDPPATRDDERESFHKAYRHHLADGFRRTV